MPLRLSVTALSVPAVVLSRTVPPELVRLLPYWSLAWTVIEDEPTSTLTEVGAAVMVVVAPGLHRGWAPGLRTRGTIDPVAVTD